VATEKFVNFFFVFRIVLRKPCF